MRLDKYMSTILAEIDVRLDIWVPYSPKGGVD